MAHLGKRRPGSTVYIPFTTYSGDTGASLTMTGLAVTDIEVYKDGSVTQRASDNGYTLLDTDGTDFDGMTGVHGFSISLADNTTAGFWAAGSHYIVVVSSVTVDSQTVNFIAATFDIGYEGAWLDTTIATLTNQTTFTLTNGPAENDALNGCIVVIHDVASAAQMSKAVVADYVGSTKTVTLLAAPTFTIAATDNVSFFAPAIQPTVWGRTIDVSAGNKAGIDWANIDSPTTTVNLSGTTVGTAAAVTTVNGLAANTVTATAIANDALTAAKIADGAIDRATFAADTGLQTTRSNTAQAGAAGSITLDASASATTDFYKGMLVYLTGSTGAGQIRVITAYNGTTKVASVAPNWATNPGATTTFAILPLGPADLQAILGAAVSTSTAQLGVNAVQAGGTAWGSGAITSGAVANDALTAAKFAADVGAEFADAVWDEALAGHATAGSAGKALGDVGAPPTAGTIADAVWDEALAGHAAAGSAGEALSTAGSGASASTIADAVWDEALAGHATGGSAGAALSAASTAGDPWGTALPGSYTAGQAGYLLGTNLNATVSSRATQTTADAIETDTQDIQSRIGTPSNLGGGASLSANLADIEAQTDEIGAAGAGLTAVPWNAAWNAQVQGEAEDALEVYQLDHLIAAADPGGVVANNSFLAKLVSKSATADFTSYNNTTDSMEAQADQDAAIKAKTDALVFTAAGRVDANVEAINNSTASADILERSSQGIGYGTVGSGSSTTSVVCGSLTPAPTSADQLVGRSIVFSSTTTTTGLRGQGATISANTTGSTATLTVSTLTDAPASGDTFTIN